MKRRLLQVIVSEEEYKEYMSKYGAAIVDGVCASKSDYIRQMLGLNGSQPTKDAIQDSEPNKSPEINNEIADKEADESASQLSIDFGKLDI